MNGRPAHAAVLAVILSAALCPPVMAQAITVTRAASGSNQTNLGHGIVLNKNSSLEREWIVIHNPNMPADIEGTAGVRTVYEAGRATGSYRYLSDYFVVAKEPIAAIETRFLLLDVWGDLIRTLSATEVVDMETGPGKMFHGVWNLFSETEASKFHTSIAYIARVRTKSGRVIEGNPTAVLAEAKKLSKHLVEGDLEPKPDRK